MTLLSENVRWDKEGKFRNAIDMYLACCLDEKFITARQAIQGLSHILKATNQYEAKPKQKLASSSLANYKDS